MGQIEVKLLSFLSNVTLFFCTLKDLRSILEHSIDLDNLHTIFKLHNCSFFLILVDILSYLTKSKFFISYCIVENVSSLILFFFLQMLVILLNFNCSLLNVRIA